MLLTFCNKLDTLVIYGKCVCVYACIPAHVCMGVGVCGCVCV